MVGFGLKYMRNVPFIAVSLLPMSGWYLDQAVARMGCTRTHLWRTGIVILLSVLLGWQITKEWQKRDNGWPVVNSYPKDMALFLLNSGLSGQLFNDYGAGGYLDWALYPKWQTFIDGRGLDYRVFDHFKEIIIADKRHGVLLEQYKIDVVALPISTGGGRVQPLLISLLNNPRWTPVYLDGKFFVLARSSEKNNPAINRHKVDKIYFLDSILTLYNGYVNKSPEDLKLMACYTELLSYAGKYPEAEIMLAKIELMWPGAEVIPLLRRQIDFLNVKR